MKERDIRENGIRIDVKRGFQITQQHGTMCIVHDGHRYDVDGYDMYIVEKQEPWPAIGSLGWAAQMMLEGESVTRTEWEKSKWYSMSRAFLKMIASHIHGTDSVALSDIGAWKAEMKSQGLTSGWQIYEPQPKIGSLDWAIQMMREGEKIFRPDWADKTARISMVVEDKITWESDALGIIIMDMRKWDSRILGKYRNSGWQIYEPQPKIGSLDWAIQMMREGKKIFRSEWKDKTARICMIAENRVKWEWDKGVSCIWDLDDWMHLCSSDDRNSGWEIYEPKPHYQVGDWVEICSNENVYPCEVVKVGKDSISIDFAGNYRTVPTDHSVSMTGIKLIRKISPHDVVLDFGKGIKGNVRKYGESSDMVWIGKHMIFMPDIAEPMRTTVKELLKAQEEEKCGN